MASSSSSSPSLNAAVSPPRSPNLSSALSDSCKIDDNAFDHSKKESLPVDDDYSFLVGWWFGVTKDGKDPYGHIIQIRADHGRYLARSYSPWQLATAKMGTSLFELYVTSNEESKDKKQAIYLKHKAAGEGIDYETDMKELSMSILHWIHAFKTDEDQAIGTLMNSAAANALNATNPLMKMACSELKINPNIQTKAASGYFDGKVQTTICIDFAIGNVKEKNKRTTSRLKNKKEKHARKLKKELRRVPAVLQRKGCFSFCFTVEEDRDQKFGDDILEGYRTIDQVILDYADQMMGERKLREDDDAKKLWPLMCSQALNQQPALSGLTTFNKINVTASSDPLTGIYCVSNGFIVTEVYQFTRKFGHWQENCEIQNPSEIEPYDYVEAVKLTGDPDVPAGQVAFRAKVAEKYKIPPGFALEKKFGAVACYKGQGRLSGFQESGSVDVEVIILGKEYRKDGFALGLLYSASKYYVFKLFKQLNLPNL